MRARAPSNLGPTRLSVASTRTGRKSSAIIAARGEKCGLALPRGLAARLQTRQRRWAAAALVEMGYVGWIVTGEDNAMLLRLPEGGVARLVLGDRTPDGRTLSAIADNTLTLKSGDGTEEVLELFPRRVPEPGA